MPLHYIVLPLLALGEEGPHKDLLSSAGSCHNFNSLYADLIGEDRLLISVL